MNAPRPGSRGPGAATVHASAPGRVNLMGEHTDYNDGYVLPVPIPQHTHVTLEPRADRTVSVWSSQHAALEQYVLGREARRWSWIDYVQGVTSVLRARCEIAGFEAHVSSSVPMGAGLSSSAALSVALLRALRAAFALALDDVAVAQLGRAAEVEFVGVPVGIMDPMACSLGRPGRALLLDTRSLQARDIPIPRQLALVVLDSRVTHAHDVGGYRQRRSECSRAAEQLGVAALRDATPELLAAHPALEPTLQRRARHVISENARVLATVEALERVDRSRLRALFAASHASLRDDFEVSVPAIDQLVALAEGTPGVIGARLTGGGFGGSVVMLAERTQALAAARAIAIRYAEQTGCTPSVLLPQGDIDARR